jgi:hypothetical protein
MSSGLDWRAPGSDRTPVKPSWSPTDQRSVVVADPFRATPAASGQGPVPAPIMPGLPGFDLRPGIVPLRPLSLGDVYGGVIRAIRGNVGSTMGLAAGTTMVFLVPLTALAAWVGSLTTLGDSSLGIGSFAAYIPTAGTWLSTILLAGFMAYVIGQGVLGRMVTARETFARTMSRIGALLVATLMVVGSALLVAVAAAFLLFGALLANGSSNSDSAVAGAVLGSLVLLAVAMVVMLALQTYFAFTTSAVVLERLSAPRAIARSWRLVGPPNRSGFWRILGIRLLTSLVTGIVAQVIATPMSMIGLLLVAGLSGEGISQVYFAAIAVLQGLVAILTGILTTPFIAGVDAMLYIDARIRKEALDVQLLQAAQGGRTTLSGVWR